MSQALYDPIIASSHLSKLIKPIVSLGDATQLKVRLA